MKLIAQCSVEFPSLGRYVHQGEFEATEEEAKIFLESPFITTNENQDGTHSKTRRSGDRS